MTPSRLRRVRRKDASIHQRAHFGPAFRVPDPVLINKQAVAKKDGPKAVTEILWLRLHYCVGQVVQPQEPAPHVSGPVALVAVLDDVRFPFAS